MRLMAAITGIEPVAAPPISGPREQKESARAPVEFGGAVTYREMVEAKLRVDPASLAEKKRKADPTRQREEPPRESARAQRFAEDDSAYDAEMGQRLDISV
jgi:hypothetical protein